MNSDQDWMNWALQIEEDLDTDISAGLDIGENLRAYLTELAESQNEVQINPCPNKHF